VNPRTPSIRTSLTYMGAVTFRAETQRVRLCNTAPANCIGMLRRWIEQQVERVRPDELHAVSNAELEPVLPAGAHSTARAARTLAPARSSWWW